LIYIKRFFWWVGKRLFFVFYTIFDSSVGFFGWIGYKTNQFLKKTGLRSGGRTLARDVLAPAVFILVFLFTFPETKMYSKKTVSLPGQKTLAFSLFSSNQDYSFEEIQVDESQSANNEPSYSWHVGVLSSENLVNSERIVYDQDLTGVYAGGMAIGNPYIMTGSVTSGGTGRKGATEYLVEAGDSLNSIAGKFGVDVATILWQNGLNSKSKIKIGQKLIIPPAVGVMHIVARGDSLLKIAKLYSAKVDDIIKFNNLDSNGGLKIGETIMVPGGSKPQSVSAPQTIAKIPAGVVVKNGKYYKNGKAYVVEQTTYGDVITPPASSQSPGASGFVWPTAARNITQYFGWKHPALDIAGPFETPTYAAKSGVVEKSQCGWNSGYGCEIIIDHGNGIKTLYGHHSRLLVSVGEHVDTGQTIGLMGNTGNVRGITGIHLHFELIIKGARVNPLGYVR